ncbi:hypothetical protein EDEG_01689 [Edhazardia aedis USNM 41457]|uniref:Inositol polyphosphate-related phosphatase domain-containing protein n=1 Tax=Edhazardia aedis (strain USNM 41457) TaxID=1003232 RepID=J9D946_EDHAE|nr:hypothetical protein EDEG_01689 [Edhazardia aedis USNM 41457]|eukprot:EJW04024.1 hypothetical protein EDEG_01689 [Edhazardia aedis USNM 41457]
MNISVLTFNTNNNLIDVDDLERIKENLSSDVIILNLQEFYYPFSYPNEFLEKIGKTFEEYELTFYDRFFGLITLILQKNNGISKIKPLKIGLGPCYFGNKGFISVLMNDTIYINAHLSAHTRNNTKRLDMIDDIFALIRAEYELEKTKIHTIVLSGDLNFRNEPSSSGKNNLRELSYPMCKEIDQIRHFQQKYPEFVESEITFEPTYKYEPGTDKFSKKRVSSYCDRILVCSNKAIKFDTYSSINDIKSSDHKPVFANFGIGKENINDKQLVFAKKYPSRLLAKVISRTYGTLYDNILLVIVFLGLLIILRICWKFGSHGSKNNTPDDIVV